MGDVCFKCGAKVQPHDKFCSNCGASLEPPKIDYSQIPESYLYLVDEVHENIVTHQVWFLGQTLNEIHVHDKVEIINPSNGRKYKIDDLVVTDSRTRSTYSTKIAERGRSCSVTMDKKSKISDFKPGNILVLIKRK